MTPLLLALALTSPAQPPVYPGTYRPGLPPGVRVQPQVSSLPAYRPPVVTVPVPVPVYPTPGYPTITYPTPVLPVQPQAVTLGEFSRYFAPTPGRHDVWIVHPVTLQPVKVCFVLPVGKLRDFEVNRRSILFDFGRSEVEILFRANGTAAVKYRD